MTPIQVALLEQLDKVDIIDAEEALHYQRISEDAYVARVVSFFFRKSS